MGIFIFLNLMGGTKEVCQRFFKNSKKLLVFEFWWVVLIFDYAPTSSLRGPATQHLNPRPKAEFDGTDGTGWTVIKSFHQCSSNFVGI